MEATTGASDVTFRYGRNKTVLQGLTFVVDPRSTVIVGPNGAGKSTLLKLLAGQLAPNSGSITMPRSIGYCPQMPVILSAFTVTEQIEYAGWLNGLARKQVRSAASRALELVRLADLGDQPASKLSGGQTQRLGIACALVTDPHLLLLDEPSAALDPIARQSVTEVLSALASRGVIVIATSHTAADVGDPFERLVLMHRGAISYDGDPGSFLRDDHHDPMAVEFARALRGR